MTNPKAITLIQKYSDDALWKFINDRNHSLTRAFEPLWDLQDESHPEVNKIGEIEFSTVERLIVCSIAVARSLNERSGKKQQYDLAKKILTRYNNDFDGIFVFHDPEGNFRFSLIYRDFVGNRQKLSNYRRFTYYVSPNLTNKTFLQRVGDGDFSSMEKIKEAFSVEKVTKEFYQEISYWYFWACQQVRFPEAAEREENGRQVSVIRMITRLIFIWFMREKGLVPAQLFDRKVVTHWLKELDDESSSYYLAILQNLFFATLNTEVKNRQFRSETRGHYGHNPDFDNPYKYRHQAMFAKPECLEEYFREIPFLNGGLFDCLDNKKQGDYFDGFSDVKKNQPIVPNQLFFSPEQPADFNAELGTTNRNYKVKGLFEILGSYNFTIDENTADDKDIALDPELLGRVFENLLASFNPETSTTARKATGSYYTPREIVDYMVDESLKAYLSESFQHLPEVVQNLDWLLSPQMDGNPFTAKQCDQVIKMVEKVRIVDPAVGSGAFPMGILNKLVLILSKLDPEGKLWEQAQLNAVASIPDTLIRADVQAKIRASFREKNHDYGRKLYLIQKCIYGVDIQQIAVEIAKLRFFISLLVDETVDREKENWGIQPLPNLDFKIMQGNSLISIYQGIDLGPGGKNGPPQDDLFSDQGEKAELIRVFRDKKDQYQGESDHDAKQKLQKEIDQLLLDIFKINALEQRQDYARRLSAIDRKYQSIPDPKTREKLKAIEKEKVSKEMGISINADGRALNKFSAQHIKRDFFPWGLYFAEVFDEKQGFDIMLGNPPYIQLQKDGGSLADLYADKGYETFTRSGDIYGLFYELGYKLLRKDGHLCFITSNKWMRAGYGEPLRIFFAEKTNPKLLIDFAGKQLFDNVTVDNNILLYQKSENKRACRTLSAGDEFKAGSELANYINAKLTVSNNFIDGSAWVISSPIEDQIRRKIESMGTPLGEWDINIYYGIKTGFNDAFIVDGKTKDRLIAEDPRSAEILKPLLRGKDIKRYRAEFADLWLIATFPAQRININNYPAIKGYLLSFGKRLHQVGEEYLDEQGNRVRTRKKSGNKWFETQDQIAYHAEFEKEKIIYPNMTKYLPFYLDHDKYYTNQKCFIMTGESLSYLTALFNSQLFKFVFREKFPVLLGGTRELSKIFFDKLSILKIDAVKEEEFHELVVKMQDCDSYGNSDLGIDEKINTLIYDNYGLNNKERELINSYVL